MRGRFLVVPRAEAERTRVWLRESGYLRDDARIKTEGDFVLLPVSEALSSPQAPGRFVEREIQEPATEPIARSYRDLAHVPTDVRRRLPRSFDVIGDIVLVRIPSDLDAYRDSIGLALLAFVPHARIVGADDGVQGANRRRVLRRIAGVGDWSTAHRENALTLDVDVERAYFSPRLSGEHARVAAQVTSRESVLDLCCGIGPFSLLIAQDGRARRVTSVDRNSEAIRLLESSARRNRITPAPITVVSPIETWLPCAETFDRVIFNLPLEGIKYLAQVAATVAPGGSLHYYEITPRAERSTRSAVITRSLGPGDWRRADEHLVHPYSPRSDLVAYAYTRRS